MSGLDARCLAALLREVMVDPEDEAVTLDAVVGRAVEVVPGCTHAGITLHPRRGEAVTVARTHDLVVRAEDLQARLDEGPWRAVAENDVLASNDLAHDVRLPRWGPAVADLGVGSVIAVRLDNGDRALGALTLYATSVDAYDDDALDVASTYGILAAHATGTARTVAGLQTALQTRHSIGMAQGILISQYGIAPARAFEVLRRYSMQRNVPLREVAAHVVEHGRLPDAGVGIADVEDPATG